MVALVPSPRDQRCEHTRPNAKPICEPVILAGHRRITLMSAVTGSSALLSRPVILTRAHPPDNIGRVGERRTTSPEKGCSDQPTKPLNLHCTINREAGKEKKKSWRQCKAKALLREFFQTLNFGGTDVAGEGGLGEGKYGSSLHAVRGRVPFGPNLSHMNGSFRFGPQ